MLMFFGTSSIVDKDVLAALGQQARVYQIVRQRIPPTDPAAVAAALSVQEVDADLVAIVRGGGEGPSALSDRQVIDAVAHQVPIPIVSAVGHEVDRPLRRFGVSCLPDSNRTRYLARSQSDRCHPSA